MFRFVRQLVAILVAAAWIAGMLAPVAFADAPLAPAAVTVAHDATPCHGDDPNHHPGQNTGKPCPFFPLCAAKCFQAMPAALAPTAVWDAVVADSPDFANDRADGHSPSPPLKIPRA